MKQMHTDGCEAEEPSIRSRKTVVLVPSGRGTERNFFSFPGANGFFVVNITTQPSFTFGNPVSLPKISLVQTFGNAPRNYDITPDGKRFIGLFPSDQLQ